MDGTILSDNPRKFIIEAESEVLAEKEVNNLCDRMSIDYEMVVTFVVENIVAC